MRGAIIASMLGLSAFCACGAFAQEKEMRPRYVYVAEGAASSSSSWWPSWKMPNLWPTGLGSRIASGTRSSWNTMRTGSSRAWYSTQYTLAPWSKPKPAPLTGSRGMASAKKPKTESSGSWWPKLDFWNSETEKKKLETVGDWQMQSSPAAGFDD